MQFFKISKDQVDHIFNRVGELPAKHVLSVIDILRTLVPIAEAIVPAAAPIIGAVVAGVEKIEEVVKK